MGDFRWNFDDIDAEKLVQMPKIHIIKTSARKFIHSGIIWSRRMDTSFHHLDTVSRKLHQCVSRATSIRRSLINLARQTADVGAPSADKDLHHCYSWADKILWLPYQVFNKFELFNLTLKNKKLNRLTISNKQEQTWISKLWFESK